MAQSTPRPAPRPHHQGTPRRGKRTNVPVFRIQKAIITSTMSYFDRCLLLLVLDYGRYGSGEAGCFASLATLADELGCTPQYVSSGLKRLVAGKWLISEKRPRGESRPLRMGEKCTEGIPTPVGTCTETSQLLFQEYPTPVATKSLSSCLRPEDEDTKTLQASSPPARQTGGLSAPEEEPDTVPLPALKAKRDVETLDRFASTFAVPPRPTREERRRIAVTAEPRVYTEEEIAAQAARREANLAALARMRSERNTSPG